MLKTIERQMLFCPTTGILTLLLIRYLLSTDRLNPIIRSFPPIPFPPLNKKKVKPQLEKGAVLH